MLLLKQNCKHQPCPVMIECGLELCVDAYHHVMNRYIYIYKEEFFLLSFNIINIDFMVLREPSPFLIRVRLKHPKPLLIRSVQLQLVCKPLIANDLLFLLLIHLQSLWSAADYKHVFLRSAL